MPRKQNTKEVILDLQNWGLQNDFLLNIAGILGFHVTLQGSKSQILLLKSNLNYYWFRQNVYSQSPILSEFSGL